MDKTTYINVLEVREDTLQSCKLFTGTDKDAVVHEAEKYFLSLCGDIPEEDKDDALDDGHYTVGAVEVYLNWPEVA